MSGPILGAVHQTEGGRPNQYVGPRDQSHRGNAALDISLTSDRYASSATVLSLQATVADRPRRRNSA